jgi:membrane-bound lytic murein transglycosylase D
MLNKKTILLLLVSLLFNVLSVRSNNLVVPSVNQNKDKDTTGFTENPIVDRLDSLVSSKFFTNTIFTTDVSKLNKYNFPNGYVPSYSDSVYRARVNKLNVNSPFEFIYNDDVKTFINVYAFKKRHLTERVLGLAEIYFPLFEEQLDRYDVPLEMKYLAIIESALNPIARSRCGASGLWQFMLGTGKMYDLNVTSYVDDRFDPFKATIAACRHMRDLYNIYNDWALVLAAYNAGPGCINKAIRKANFDTNTSVTYWKIKKFLPKETQSYVPAFIAVTYVMNYATEHNIYPKAPSVLNCEVDTVTVKQQLTFKQISEFLCLPYEEIQFLNPAYKKGVIPSTADNHYIIRLPRNKVADFVQNEFALYNYKTEAELAYQKQLAQISEIKNIPPKTVVAVVVEKEVAQVADTAKSDGLNQPAPQPNPKQTNFVNNSNNNSKVIYYTVQKGDSLWRIASKYSVTVEALKKLNNIKDHNNLYPGQKLKVSKTT